MISHEDRHASEGFDFCDTTHCQLYRGEQDLTDARSARTVFDAVAATAGEFLSYEGLPIEGHYSAVCGGISVTPSMVWGGSERYPYKQITLSMVPCFEIRSLGKISRGFEYSHRGVAGDWDEALRRGPVQTRDRSARRIREISHHTRWRQTNLAWRGCVSAGNRASTGMEHGVEPNVHHRAQRVKVHLSRPRLWKPGWTVRSGSVRASARRPRIPADPKVLLPTS